jgi:general secretion pathway protein D
MKCKAVLSLLLALTAAPAATLSIDPSSLTVGVGQSFDLNVDIANVSDLFAFQFDIAFNPAVLSATSVSEGSFLPGGGTTAFVPGTIDNTAGKIAVTADALVGMVPGVSGSGVLATLQFSAIGVGTSPISLSNIILLDSGFNSIDVTSSDGSVTANGSAVPEPSVAGASLLGVGMLLAISVRRKRRP